MLMGKVNKVINDGFMLSDFSIDLIYEIMN